MATASTKSSADIRRRDLLILAAASLLSICIYLAASALTLRIGFPLDDSWIHLTYARNLALHGEWAFLPGVPSAGSTAPLWSVLLAIGFLLRLAPYIWTYFLGGFFLFALAAFAEISARRLLTSYRPHLPLIGLFFAFEWHLVWSAGSGMETLLHASLVTIFLILLAEPTPRPLTLGLLAALTVWVRPDGLTLLGPAVLTLALHPKPASSLTRFFIGFGFLFGMYLLFNLMLSGNPFPNTFYAKQAEYAAWQSRPLLEKLGTTFLQFLTGPALVLFPGAIIWLVKSIRERDWGTLAGMIWLAGFVSIYALRLPPYQHGRYLMPAMPIFFLWGLLGLARIFQKAASRPTVGLMRVAWAAVVMLVTVGFVGLGVRSYALDVAYIETEMVETAKWVDANLPPNALIAAHDIGALGYFDHHQLIDLAGLVSPDVIPFLRDETRLAEYLDAQSVDYFVAFPNLYPNLALQSQEVYSTQGTVAPMLGGENLSVYRWRAR
ncbi:MAG: hypothetical protein ACOYZ6_11320 [Chloroflexota bacterium]